MRLGPSISSVAALIGDPARANMLSALMNGAALTASELALEAGVTRPTASSHLSKLSEAELVSIEKQGRHRYYRIADEHVAAMLESLSGLADRMGLARTRPGPKEPALRRARVCYDHLAGDVGVAIYDDLVRRGCLAVDAEGLTLTEAGRRFFGDLHVPVPNPAPRGRPLCRPCLDWSVRRNHLAGVAGAALLQRLLDLGWIKRRRDSRVIEITPDGGAGLRRTFGLSHELFRDEGQRS
ncbi:MAG: helix-turn-helix transcriptional regulator [Brevundimonas sp.]|uniref:ArsR/SmtB family transcription factor n=1 Tax=Brevundimonas sp. TaxID=1871086 RepID=UPI002486DDE5|nr:helix-turn-helix transcriptional regulator [Brevundimonas sp.]MDI1327775.1 helix-turn-helix transcriptional regulator [Brevundimonas sp.]